MKPKSNTKLLQEARERRDAEDKIVGNIIDGLVIFWESTWAHRRRAILRRAFNGKVSNGPASFPATFTQTTKMQRLFITGVRD